MDHQTPPLFRQAPRFIFGASEASQLSHRDLAPDSAAGAEIEWAVAGRSNVGKSSLLNALFNNGKLARVSRTPGRTRQINFFECAYGRRLADLPGYGYAKVSKEERHKWDVLLDCYFSKRPLRFLLLLIDSRHALKEADALMMDYLDARAVPYASVLTKIDKAKKENITALQEELHRQIKRRPAALEHVFPVSAHKRTGLLELQLFICDKLELM